MQSQVQVSIICNTFNHEKYIAQTIESMICQRTDFNFEILIHDDASSDSTPMIIKHYENLYPDIIKPIYQKVNQYSKNIDITLSYQIPRAKGDYIAFCEGDDYWIDEHKLQRQFNILEELTEINMCSHSAQVIDASSKRVLGFLRPSTSKCILSPFKVICGGGGYLATNSLFFRKCILEHAPRFYTMMPFDYTLQVLGAIDNGIAFTPDISSVYRFGTPNSWTSNMKVNLKKSIRHNERVLQMLNQLDLDTNKKYFSAICYRRILNKMKSAYYLMRCYMK